MSTKQLTFRRHRPSSSDEFFEALESAHIPCCFDDTQESLDWVDGNLAYKFNDNWITFDLVKEYHSHQKKNYSLSKEPLAKALKLKVDLAVVDASCGTGKDSMLLLSLGAKVHAYERNPTVFALLLDAYHRLKDSTYSDLIERFEISFGSPQNCEFSDLCYFDPMYETEKIKKSLPRIEMQMFKDLVGPDSDQDNEIVRLSTIFKTLVLKRPLKAPSLPQISYRISGKTTRYDVIKKANA